MPATVEFTTTKPLTVPADAYNQDGLAVLILTGGRYGGMWIINACHGPGDNPEIVGTVQTEVTYDSDVAAATGWAWARQECERLGLKVVHTVNHNDRYAPNERPFFTLSQVVVADKDWT